MATFTITTPVNFDSLSVKAGGDTYNVNGGFLTIDGDTRYGLNAAAAGMGPVTPSATLGGTVSIDARYVRLIPYDTGSGNVPAYNTSITQGSASGVLIGVYDTLAVAPTTPGSAMPANGYIKIKQWNSVAYSAGALTGIGANATGADVVGWIEVVGNEGPTNWTFSRLNNPTTPLIQGDWYEIGTTGGSRTDTYQIPSNGVNQYHGGVWVEGAASVSITGASYNTTDKRATITATSHGFETGDKITISGVTPTGYNATVYVRKLTANTFSYFLDEDPGTYTSGGTAAGNYEFYPSTSDTMTVANIPTSALKGKWCKIATDGTLRFGHDGTNSTGGYLPPSGRKIRIGNVFMTSATTGVPTQNSYNATTSSRPRFITSGAGRIDVRYASFNWGFGSLTNPQLLNMENTAIVDSITPTNVASSMTLTNVGFGSPTAFAATRIVTSTFPEGADLTDVTIGLSGQSTTANVNGINFTDADTLNLTRVKIWYSASRGATTQVPFSFSRASNITMTECVYSGGLTGSSSSEAIVKGGFAFDNTNEPNKVATALYTYNLSTSSNNWDIDGVAIENGDMSRNGILTAGSSSSGLTVRNIGSAASPIGTGLWEEDGASWSRVTTVCTVTTSSPHGLATNDIVNVWRTDTTAAIARGLFTVTGTPTSTTFTFTCVNSGATSGVLSYYPTQPARMFLLANNSNVKFQNVNIVGTRTALYGTDNTSTGVEIVNCYSDWRDASSVAPASNNTKLLGSSLTPISNTGNSSTYGTHMRSGYVADQTVPNATSASWTRSTTTATITKANHGLVTASRIQVLDSSNQAAFAGVSTSNVTVLTKDTFTVSCTNTGTTSGTLDYVTADGMISIDMNEDNDASTGQYVAVAGTPLFTGAGAIAMFTVNDEAYWESEEFITDFDYAENMTCQMLGGTIANYDITYDLNTGSGFSGTWKNLWYQRTGGGGSSASTDITMTDTTGVAVGDYIYGQGVATGAKVQSITNSTTIVSTIANTGTVTGTLVFNQLPNATGLGSGFKIRVKIKTITANTGAITFLRLFFRSSVATRANYYPQNTATPTYSITNIPSGSIVAIYDSSDNELFRNNNVTSGSVDYQYDWEGTDFTNNYFVVWHEDYYPFKQTGITLSSEDQSFFVSLEEDLAYDAAAANISTFDYNNEIHIMNPTVTSGGDVDIPITDLYSNWKDDITSGDNFIYDFAYEVVGGQPTYASNFVSLNFFQINGWKLRPREINHTGRITGGNLIPESGGAIVPTTGSFSALIEYQNPERSIAVTTGATASDVADAVWNEALSGHTTSGSAGKTLQDSADSAELASIT